jgi:hypothetical protein
MIIICPGFHSPQLTEDFITAMGWRQPGKLGQSFLVIPKTILPYNFSEIHQWLSQQFEPSQTPLYFIGFSAGVVGAMETALSWQQQGGTVQGLIAIDGWGVPLFGSFPLYRLSHDWFTHITSQFLGKGQRDFYCSPAVSHLALWQSPDKAWGWQEIKLGCRVYCSAAKMIDEALVERA